MSSAARKLVHLAFIYTCIEGFVVNMTYPNVLAYIIKDLLILVIYLSLMTERKQPATALRRLGAPLGAFAALTAFFLVMPTPVSLLSELVALKQRLFYIPLMYVGYAYTQTEEDAYGLIKLIAWTAIPTSLFGIYLFFAGPSAMRALGGAYSAVIYSTQGSAGVAFWRVPGTFTSPGQYSLYLLMQAVLLTGFLFVPTIERRNKIIAIIALAVSFGALLASGTRTPLVIYMLCVGLGLLYMGRLTKLGTAALVLYGIMTIAFTYFGPGVQDRVGSVLSQENYDRFRSTAFGQVFYEHVAESPLGFGLGSATIAGRHFTDMTKIIFVESYFGVIATETGYFGLIMCIWLVGQIAYVMFDGRLRVKGAVWSPLWYFVALTVLAIIGLMPSSTMIESPPGNMYFWFLIGMAMRFVDIAMIGKVARGYGTLQPSSLTPPYALPAPR